MPMTAEQFIDFVKNEFGGALNVPSNPFKSTWIKISNDIRPHYYGEIPPALLEAFPNEDSQILEYRIRNYNPVTEACIVDAVDDLHRLLATSKFSIRFDRDDMADFVTDYKINNKQVITNFFDTVVPQMILDPNGVMLVKPFGPGTEDNATPVEITTKIISSGQIVFQDPELPLLIYEEPTQSKYKTFKSRENVRYKVVTDIFFGSIIYGEKKKVKDGKREVEKVPVWLKVDYVHGLGRVPWFVLGGRPVRYYDPYGNSYRIYKSFFSSAVPYLNKAAIGDSQDVSVTLTTCFPMRFAKGIKCTTCVKGRIQGVTSDPEDYEICGDCNGTGKVVFLSPLANYYLNPNGEGEKGFRDENKPVDNTPPITFAAPPIDTIKHISEWNVKNLEKAEEVLDIRSRINAAQSGVAKDIDREDKGIKLAKISDNVFDNLQVYLEVIQGLRFMDTRSRIVINRPISFKVKDELALMNEFVKTLEGMPDSFRYAAYLDFLKKRFSTDKQMLDLSKLAARYTIHYLYTPTERDQLLLNDSITKIDAVKASRVFPTLLDMFDDDFDFENASVQQVKDELNKRLEPEFNKVMIERPNGFNNSVDDEDEDETL